MSKNVNVQLWPPFKRSGTTITQRTAGDDVDLLSASIHLNDDETVRFGNTLAANDAQIMWNTTQTVDAFMVALSDAQNTFIICEKGDIGYDFAHGAQTNPTVFLQSAAQSATEFSAWNAGSLSFGLGIAVTATDYMVGRDADGTNQLHFNVPSGAGFEFSVNDVASLTLSTTGQLRQIPVATSGASGDSGWFIQSAQTYTDNVTAGSGTASYFAFNRLGTPTLAAANSSVTTTYAYTLYLDKPVAGTNMTITNAYTLGVAGKMVQIVGTEDNYFIYRSGTFATVPASTSQTGIYETFTTAGNTVTWVNGYNIYLNAGYTGSGRTIGMAIHNNCASTGNTWYNTYGYNMEYGNMGGYMISYGTTTGTNMGVMGYARGGDLNMGGMFGAAYPKNSATNVGLFANGLNTGTSPIEIGAYVCLEDNGTSAPTWGTSAALVANNGTEAVDIASFRDNGTAKITFGDGGYSSFGGSSPTNGVVLFAGANATTMPAATTAWRHFQTGGNVTELADATITDITGAYFNTFTVTDGGGTETVANLSTVYIAGAPTAGTTPTNGPYALFVDAGTSRFDADVGVATYGSGFVIKSSDNNYYRITVEIIDGVPQLEVSDSLGAVY